MDYFFQCVFFLLQLLVCEVNEDRKPAIFLRFDLFGIKKKPA